jgi:hypothetical protein
MRITPLNYTNQKNNKPSFGAILGSLKNLTTSSQMKLTGQTDAFLSELLLLAPKIEAIKSPGRTVTIDPIFFRDAGSAFRTKPCLEVNISVGIDKKQIKVPFSHWGISCNGKTLARRFVTATEKTVKKMGKAIAEKIEHRLSTNELKIQ